MAKKINKNGQATVKENQESLSEYFSDASWEWQDRYEYSPETCIYDHMEMTARRNSAIDYVLKYSEGDNVKVLDIGSGPGTMLDKRLLNRCDMTLMDLSFEMVRKAQLKAENQEISGAAFNQACAMSLPYKDGFFDAVTALGVLEYIPDEEVALNEICRVLKPEGIAVLSFPNYMKFGNILDPYFVFVRIPQYIWFKIASRPAPVATRGELYAKNKYFSNRRYRLSRLIRKLAKQNLYSKELTMIGFGPLMINRKTFIPHKISIKMFKFLEATGRRPVWRWLRYFANRWVICLQKTS